MAHRVCTTRVRARESCGTGLICTNDGFCVYDSTASCGAGQVVGDTRGGNSNCLCTASTVGTAICVNRSALTGSTAGCGQTHPDCSHGGPFTNGDPGLCVRDPCRNHNVCVKPCE